MKIIILCGGRGIRAFPYTNTIPKPMLPVAGSPMLLQIIRAFIAQGFAEFVLAAGYRRAVIEDYFEGKDVGARIDIIDTGEDADTGDRILACREYVGDTFLATYGDGLTDLPMKSLVDFHSSHDGLATVTSVPLRTNYGIVESDASGRVSALLEKPVIKERWINIGFLLCNRNVFDHWEGHSLERDVLPRLAKRGVLYNYRHDGFFKSMDSHKDQQEFDDLAENGPLPWLLHKEDR